VAFDRFDLPADEPSRLRKQAERHRRVAQTLTSPADEEIALDEARRVDAKASKIETWLDVSTVWRAPPPFNK
jgi:hypothetical protein